MQFSIATIVLALSALTSASVILERQTRATGACCLPSKSIKQEVCTTAGGAQGRCVPGGGGANCNGALDCVAQTALTCDASVIERGNPLCRAKVAGGLQDGTKVIQNLSQAKVN
ncbi:uncharacterized protein RAG0_08889 [Rhynchosporium agropyri]|uniref:Extracellular membrane protein CFEM domain-containing protein n=3 Tax=Rhynchosporium TaxID=38037 RepID=A0A1E1LWN9_RHYSE|nr:uncharacterized protein RCO7_00252 [Rhynchosporium commune]CZT01085.1 uncharacterized protein RAG0_08889 [Rhynchosporium agropyri]CZT40675.1 uncharacterized protein RSE6_00314 [Rhynchosporium secalis]